MVPVKVRFLNILAGLYEKTDGKIFYLMMSTIIKF